jgi:hypothetical protein
MATPTAESLYMAVVQDVIDKVKDSFLDEAVDENVLQVHFYQNRFHDI